MFISLNHIKIWNTSLFEGIEDKDRKIFSVNSVNSAWKLSERWKKIYNLFWRDRSVRELKEDFSEFFSEDDFEEINEKISPHIYERSSYIWLIINKNLLEHFTRSIKRERELSKAHKKLYLEELPLIYENFEKENLVYKYDFISPYTSIYHKTNSYNRDEFKLDSFFELSLFKKLDELKKELNLEIEKVVKSILLDLTEKKYSTPHYLGYLQELESISYSRRSHNSNDSYNEISTHLIEQYLSSISTSFSRSVNREELDKLQAKLEEKYIDKIYFDLINRGLKEIKLKVNEIELLRWNSEENSTKLKIRYRTSTLEKYRFLRFLDRNREFINAYILVKYINTDWVFWKVQVETVYNKKELEILFKIKNLFQFVLDIILYKD